MRFSCAEEALSGVKSLLFHDQLTEENILLDIYSPNNKKVIPIDLRRLNIDRVFSRKQISNRFLFKRTRLVDSVKYQEDYSVQTILEIKNEQRRLGINFSNYYTLLSKSAFRKHRKEPLLFVQVEKDIFYLINDFQLKEKEEYRSIFNTLKHWLKKGIFTKMSSK